VAPCGGTVLGAVRIAVADFGATLQAFEVPDAAGIATDIVLGHDTLDKYVAADACFGANVGGYGNRIRASRAMIDSKASHLDRNEGLHHLHGGRVGFDRKPWRGAACETGDALVFHRVSPDGDMGYPGRLDAWVTYRLTAAGALEIEMTARTDQPTHCNLVQHSYFNLAGGGDITGYIARFDADFYTPVDDDLPNTGEIRSVAGTPFDFRQPNLIGRDLLAASPRPDKGPSSGLGYDHNLVLGARKADGLRDCATLMNPSNGLGLALRTTDPGCQFFSGGDLSGTIKGKGQCPSVPFGGLTLEAQIFPQAPECDHFPSATHSPGQTYRHVMIFQMFHNRAVPPS